MITLLRYFFVFTVFTFQSICGESLAPSLTIEVPMRDGLMLPTDIYLPPTPGKAPGILLRVPAGRKAMPWVEYANFSRHGYVVAIQDTRSVIDPDGKTFPYLTDGWGKLQDGYDAVEWLANSEYTNGKVGTLGFSAAGITQLLLAPAAPPSLKCQYIGIAPASLYHHVVYPGGQVCKNQVEGWLGMYAKDSGVLGVVVNNPLYNPFWASLNTMSVAHKVQAPGLHYTGWFDPFVQGTIDAFVTRQDQGGPGALGNQKLLVGPWSHYYPLVMKLGDFNVPSQGLAPPHDTSAESWFDYYLRGNPNGVSELPNVIYYVMGPFDGSPSSGNVWRTSNVWPVPADNRSLYLTCDNTLQETNPTREKGLAYSYDPQDPIHTVGGRNLFLESGPKDQRPLEARKDVLVFTSDPLSDDLEVTGQVVSKLFFSSDQPDTDVVVRLTDVYPDGRSILIAEGIHRTGPKHCTEREHKLNSPHEIEVDLWSTSIVFAKDHKIRISISSSNFPRHEKNANVGLTGSHSGNYAVANNCFYLGGKYPSRLILPVVKR